MNIKDKSLITSFQSLINTSDKIVIVPHNNPDGDAMGASLGLFNTLLNMNKQSTVISPNAYPEYLKWMPGVDQVIVYEEDSVKALEVLDAADCFIFVDFNALSRIDQMTEYFQNDTKPRFMIDHHPYPEEATASYQISVPEASSTCELLYQVIKEAAFEEFVTVDAAECIYSGIMTDTGSLNYNSNRPETYLTVANLLEKGINKDKIHHQIFQNNSFSKMQLLGFALSEKMELLPELKAAFISLSKEELERFNYQSGDTEGFVNQALWIEGVDVSALITEKDDMVKMSFRSRGDFPVNKFSSAYFEGGGHHNAAGGKSELSLADTIEKFKSALKEYRTVEK